MAFKTKVVLVVLLAALLIGVPPGLGQQPPADNKGGPVFHLVEALNDGTQPV